MKLRKGTLLFLLLTSLTYTTLAQEDYILHGDDVTIDENGIITACSYNFGDNIGARGIGGGTNLTIPKSVTKNSKTIIIKGIGIVSADDSKGIFEEKTLVSLTFVDSEVETIGSRAFRYNQIKTLDLPATLTTIGDFAFDENQIPKLNLENTQLTVIEQSAFRKNKIAELSLPTALTTIENSAFRHNQIKTLNLSTALTTIGNSAFSNNDITILTFPDDSQLASIGQYAFLMNKITGLILPPTLTTIGESAFLSNESLESFTLPLATKEGFRTYWKDGSSADLGANPTITAFGESFELDSIEQVTLTTAVEGQQAGTIARSVKANDVGKDMYDIGTEVELTAEPNTGWRFDKWVISDEEGKNDQITTVTLDVDKEAVAYFVEQVTLTVSIDGNIGGNILPREGTFTVDKVNPASNQQLTATAGDSYRFDKWVINGQTIATTTVIITLDQDRTATAHFVQLVTLTTSVEGQQGGTISATPNHSLKDNQYDINTEVTLTATPQDDWRFDKWVITVGEDENGNPITETVDVVGVDVTVDADKTATAYFVKQFTLTTAVAEQQGGTISATPNPSLEDNQYDINTEVTLTATHQDGWRFDKWEITGEEDKNDKTTTITLDQDKTATAHFVKQVTLTRAIEGEGSINPLVKPNSVDPDNEMKGMYDINTKVTLTAEPNSGWKFDKWEISDEEDKTDKVTTITLNTDKTVTAHFVKEEEAITSILTEVVSATPYPNPVTSQITLKAKDGDLIQLFSQKGEQQYSTQHTGNEVHTIDVSTMPIGVYLVRITDAEGKTTTKRIVKK